MQDQCFVNGIASGSENERRASALFNSDCQASNETIWIYHKLRAFLGLLYHNTIYFECRSIKRIDRDKQLWYQCTTQDTLSGLYLSCSFLSPGDCYELGWSIYWSLSAASRLILSFTPLWVIGHEPPDGCFLASQYVLLVLVPPGTAEQTVLLLPVCLVKPINTWLGFVRHRSKVTLHIEPLYITHDTHDRARPTRHSP